MSATCSVEADCAWADTKKLEFARMIAKGRIERASIDGKRARMIFFWSCVDGMLTQVCYMKTRLSTFLGIVALGLNFAHAGNPQFGKYWNRGKAEITSYDLEQARYGEVHPGEAVTIFVTEPFDPKKQVKADKPDGADIQVLKLNLTKKFLTGIYPYSMMLSVFTPVNSEKFSRTLKTTVSSQEWCGHTWTQLNWREGEYQGEQRSYFESEGDRDFDAGDAMLEDAVWTRIRIDPASLPQGEIMMIPGGFSARLRHRLPRPEKAIASTAEQEGNEAAYSIEYPEIGRTLRITYEKKFPHRISGWEEKDLSGFGPSAIPLSTRATLKQRLMIDYWNHHDLEDRRLRAKLGLPQDR